MQKFKLHASVLVASILLFTALHALSREAVTCNDGSSSKSCNVGQAGYQGCCAGHRGVASRRLSAP